MAASSPARTACTASAKPSPTTPPPTCWTARNRRRTGGAQQTADYQDKRYRYDAFGRMIEKRSAKRGLQRLAYDAESRLIEVRNENGSVLRVTYDPLGRRIEKTEHDTNGYPLGRLKNPLYL
nr:RHS repeat domain-containing protein [Pseudomonas lini]